MFYWLTTVVTTRQTNVSGGKTHRHRYRVFIAVHIIIYASRGKKKPMGSQHIELWHGTMTQNEVKIKKLN